MKIKDRSQIPQILSGDSSTSREQALHRIREALSSETDNNPLGKTPPSMPFSPRSNPRRIKVSGLKLEYNKIK